MSATLTWFNSGLGTKTGTAIGNLFADMVTLITSKAGDANFSWQVASSNVASTPYQITLKPKSGAAGRILVVAYTSAPAGVNPTIFDATPSLTSFYVAFFPAGNVDTPSNLSASSGTILGDDTGAVKVSAAITIAAAYGASVQFFYFDSAEAVAFGYQNPGTTSTLCHASGYILVDSSDNAYAGVLSSSTSGIHNIGSTSGSMNWSGSAVSASSSTACVRTNYGSSNRAYFVAYSPTGNWASQAVGPSDILTDTSASKAWFIPIQLLGQTKGEGFVLKLRQIALGPSSTGQFAVYNQTGPTVSDRQFCAATAGTNSGAPWFTNYKI